MTIDDAELVTRYCANYGLADQAVTAEQVRMHFALEQELTKELLASDAEHRWDVFVDCYDRLYGSLPWLTGTGGSSDHGQWLRVIGRTPRRIYEVGSGSGSLARFLADAGHQLEATDVSRERGGERSASDRIAWTVTDGVHLDRFAQGAPYDVVISDQVVEHLHPDDLDAHLRGARAILGPYGRYVLRTPHRLTGPHDVSRVFGLPEAVGMHLREYTAAELVAALQAAGFGRVRAVVPVLGRASTAFLHYVRAIERLPALARRMPKVLAPRIWLAAEAG